MNPAPIVFGVVVALAIGALVLGMRHAKGGLYQRHGAIVGGLLAFAVPIGWSVLAGNSSPNLGYLTFISAVCSIPGLLLGYFMGKKEPS